MDTKCQKDKSNFVRYSRKNYMIGSNAKIHRKHSFRALHIQ